MKRVGVLRFPGTNCDRDVFQMALLKDYEPQWLWHADRFQADDFDMILVPGGFSFGDYLRCGALAAKSTAMASVREFAVRGGPILGICNGFQILCESGLLPGVLRRNQGQKFRDLWVNLKVKSRNPYFASSLDSQQNLSLPIAHGEGNFYIDTDGLKSLYDHQQVWLTYDQNPNGSLDNIAGIMNKEKNVSALMPHPERALSAEFGGADGRYFI